MLFHWTKKDKRTVLDKEIESVISQMSRYEASSDEYKACSENLERLCKARGEKPKAEINWTPVIVGAIGLLQIVLIMTFEKTDVISTKALGFVMKGRV